RLGRRCVAEGLAPRNRFERLPMLGMFYTTEPQMIAANAAGRALEARPGVLAVSLIHGFLWADMAEMGAGVLVVTDGDRPDLAPEIETVAARFFAARGETRAMRVDVDAALDAVEAGGIGKPFVIADACDNAGGGAGSDSTFILEAILARGLTGYAIALLWDPVALRFAEAAGEGATFRLRLGGKTGPEAGRPLDVTARVLAVRSGLEQRGIGFNAPAGTAAALEIAGNIVVVNDVRGQVFSPSAFTDLGIDPAAQRALVVKSTQHFRAQFEPIAQAILYCETPGALALELDPARYANLPRPVWPLDDVDYPA
ncbi:MAG: MlrC C-terminal domain-containing protein, partial [Thermoleophilia bacterium]|nr:MlrC C-terminal domain-containing protein [Thermoleophilia bacterium]